MLSFAGARFFISIDFSLVQRMVLEEVSGA